MARKKASKRTTALELSQDQVAELVRELVVANEENKALKSDLAKLTAQLESVTKQADDQIAWYKRNFA